MTNLSWRIPSRPPFLPLFRLLGFIPHNEDSAPGSAPAEDLAPAEAPAAGSDVVNEVMASERPFSFESAISTQNVTTETVATAVGQTQTEATVEISTQNVEAVATAVSQTQTEASVAATYEISTQTDEMDSDRILAVVNPAVEEHGINRVLQRWRNLMSVISNTILSSSSNDGNGEADSADRLESTGHSPVTVTELSPASTDQVALSDSDRSESPADYTPRRLDGDFIRVVDNPTYQPTSSLDTGNPSSALASPVDDQIDDGNPYQIHRHQLYHVKRVFLYLCELLENL